MELEEVEEKLLVFIIRMGSREARVNGFGDLKKGLGHHKVLGLTSNWFHEGQNK